MDFENIDRILVEYKEDQRLSSGWFGNPIIHYHDAYEIMFLLESDNEMFVQDSLYRMRDRQIVFIPPYMVHSIEYKPGTRYLRYILNFENEYIAPLFEAANGAAVMRDLEKRQITVVDLSPQRFAKMSALFLELHRTYDKFMNKFSDLNEMRMMLALADAVAAVYEFIKNNTVNRVNISTDNLVRQIVKYIDDNHMEPITLEMIENEFHFSKSYISHKFKDATGMTFIEYLQYARVAEAQRRLTKAGATIQQVCYQCGFKNIQHFYRVFGKITGSTPGVYQSSASAKIT